MLLMQLTHVKMSSTSVHFGQSTALGPYITVRHLFSMTSPTAFSEATYFRPSPPYCTMCYSTNMLRISQTKYEQVGLPVSFQVQSPH